jgi:hypothetical protein
MTTRIAFLTAFLSTASCSEPANVLFSLPTGGGGVDEAACPVDLGLDRAPLLPNLTGEVTGNAVRIRFDPRPGAADYRVYALPSPDDVSGYTVRNATYRCAGNYAVPAVVHEDTQTPDGDAFKTIIESDVAGYVRSAEEATLGYVYTTPAEGRVPVYALGDPSIDADNGPTCFHQRWPESRVKTYTTSESRRAALLARRYRNDGVAFYALHPGAAGRGVRGIYEAIVDGSTLYVPEGRELDEREADGAAPTRAFSVHEARAPGMEPLKRVFYLAGCSRSHDELVATEPRFQKAYEQGPEQPVPELHWAGLAGDTTLIVEALDQLCPNRGVPSPIARPAAVVDGVAYPPFETIASLRAKSSARDVYIGAQGDAGNEPRVVARACLRAKPAEPTAADWRFGGEEESYSEPTTPPGPVVRFDSPTFDVEFWGQAQNEWAIGTMLGELWTLHADVAAGVPSTVRFAPKEKAALAAGRFLHVTLEVDTISTARRFPQVLVSDQPWPLSENMVNGGTVIAQVFNDRPTVAQIQFCDRATWAVNAQCPTWDLHVLHDGGDDFLAPHVEMNGLQGMDRTVVFDVYASTARVYLYTNGEPYGCVDLPAGRLLEGPATVAFGDGLEHSGIDFDAPWYPFHAEHTQSFTSRHWSNLSFTSDVPAPSWDEATMPCVAASAMAP